MTYENHVPRHVPSVVRLLMRVVPVLLLGAAYPAAVADDATAITPAEWLEAQKKPAFRDGHTLPRLTRFGWVLPTDARIKLAEQWGYAVEFGGYVDDKVVARLDDPKSDESKLAALAKADPARYPVAVICSRRLPGEETPAEAWTRDKDGKVLNAKAQSMDGTQWSEGKGAVWSPEAPDAVWQMAGGTFTRVAPGKPVSRPVDLTVAPPPSAGRLVWLAADHGVVKDASGKVSAWQSRGADSGNLPKVLEAFAVQQADAAKQPLWVADAVNGRAGVVFDKVRVHLGARFDEQAGGELAGPC